MLLCGAWKSCTNPVTASSRLSLKVNRALARPGACKEKESREDGEKPGTRPRQGQDREGGARGIVFTGGEII